MAKRGEVQKSKGNGMEMPDGFDPVGTSGPQRWVVKSAGEWLRGELVNRSSRQGKSKGSFYLVKLTDSSPGLRVIFEKNEITPKRGDLVCVDETKALEGFRSLCTDGGKYEVFVAYEEEIELEGGNTFWRMKSGRKVLKAPPAAGASNNDIPL